MESVDGAVDYLVDVGFSSESTFHLALMACSSRVAGIATNAGSISRLGLQQGDGARKSRWC